MSCLARWMCKFSPSRSYKSSHCFLNLLGSWSCYWSIWNNQGIFVNWPWIGLITVGTKNWSYNGLIKLVKMVKVKIEVSNGLYFISRYFTSSKTLFLTSVSTFHILFLVGVGSHATKVKLTSRHTKSVAFECSASNWVS